MPLSFSFVAEVLVMLFSAQDIYDYKGTGQQYRRLELWRKTGKQN